MWNRRFRVYLELEGNSLTCIPYEVLLISLGFILSNWNLFNEDIRNCYDNVKIPKVVQVVHCTKQYLQIAVTYMKCHFKEYPAENKKV